MSVRDLGYLPHAQFVKTRERIVETSNSYTDEGALCHEDARLNAVEFGVPFFAGFTYNVLDGKTDWHCFNADKQGYVFDGYVAGNHAMLDSVYFGVKLDSYLVGSTLLIDQEEDLNEKKRLNELFHTHITTLVSEKKVVTEFLLNQPEVVELIKKYPRLLSHFIRYTFMYKNAAGDQPLMKSMLGDKNFDAFVELGFLFALVDD
jgi:hypothetical protein